MLLLIDVIVMVVIPFPLACVLVLHVLQFQVQHVFHQLSAVCASQPSDSAPPASALHRNRFIVVLRHPVDDRDCLSSTCLSTTPVVLVTLLGNLKLLIGLA